MNQVLTEQQTQKKPLSDPMETYMYIVWKPGRCQVWVIGMHGDIFSLRSCIYAF